jgi:hypothetical protein
MLLCCSLFTEPYLHAISCGAIFIDEYFEEPVIRFLAKLFYVCTTNFSISGGKTVFVHVQDSAVKQVSILTSFTVQIVLLVNLLSSVSPTDTFFLSGSCHFRA